MNGEYLDTGSILHGKYRINGVIGQGGFGITYDGTDLKLDMHVAIKEYFPKPIAYRQASDSQDITCSQETASLYEQGLRNFLKEARNMAKFVGEANFVTVHDYFAENNTAYIIMEFVRGQDLRHFLKQYGRFSFQDTMSIITPVMNAVEKIHARRMIHRDISPSNIMILPDGRVKLLDFGAVREISLETQSLTTMSAVYKHGYSPIEQQTRDMKQGTYSDIYALSATIYQMLTGTIPPSPFARISGSESLIPPSRMGVRLTAKQEETLMRGLAVYGTDRPQTIRELREGFFGGPAPLSGSAGWARTGSKQRMNVVNHNSGKRRFIGLLIACLSLLVLLMSLVMLIGGEKTGEEVTDQTGGGSSFSVASSKESGSGGEESQGETMTVQTESEKEISEDDVKAQDTNETVSGNGESNTTYEDSGAGDASVVVRKDFLLKNDSANDMVSADSEADAATGQGDEDVPYDYPYPEDALEYNGHHYYIYDDSTGSWEEAAQLCTSRGGYMAVINDSEENEELYRYMENLNYDVVYFGLTRDDGGDWEYHTGDSSSFRDWGVNSIGEQEPNDLQGPSKFATLCKYMTDGHWDDVTYGKKVYTPEGRPYKHLYAYICEWGE